MVSEDQVETINSEYLLLRSYNRKMNHAHYTHHVTHMQFTNIVH